jgi:hypothetical protein
MRLTASYRWCTCGLVASRGSPDNQYQKLWPFIWTRGFLGTVWWLSSWGAERCVAQRDPARLGARVGGG